MSVVIVQYNQDKIRRGDGMAILASHVFNPLEVPKPDHSFKRIDQWQNLRGVATDLVELKMVRIETNIKR